MHVDKVYKHVPLEFADAFCRGEGIKIGTLTHYRLIEGPRNDPLEGSVQAIQSKRVTLNPEKDERVINNLEKFGVKIGANSTNTHFEGCNFIASAPLTYIFCTSTKPDESFRESGHRIFKINKLGHFSRKLKNHSEKILNFRQQRGLVNYSIRNFDFTSENPLKPNAFDKDLRFQYENEYRFCWQSFTGEADYDDHLIIRCPEVARFIHEV